MKKKMILLLLTSAFTTSLLFAQGTRTPPTPAEMAQRQVDRLTRLLGLSSAQQTAAVGIFTSAITANEAVQGNLRTARQTLQKDIEATLPGGQPSGNIPGDVNAITGFENTISLNNATAEAQFYGILSGDQQTRFSQAKNRGPGGFGGGFGPGGPGMGPQGFRRGPR